MADSSLQELAFAFHRWRRAKKHSSEAIPDHLIEEANRVAARHGKAAVLKVTGVTGLASKRIQAQGRKDKRSGGLKPTYSRVELMAPVATRPSPLAELEAPSGFKLRVFAMTPETTDLLASFSRTGDER